MRGVWRRAPGNRQQLHLFEWVLLPQAPQWGVAGGAAAAAGMADRPQRLSHIEAPSVMLVDGRVLQLEGWQGDREDLEALSHRMAVARGQRARLGAARADAPSNYDADVPQVDVLGAHRVLQTPILFWRSDCGGP